MGVKKERNKAHAEALFALLRSRDNSFQRVKAITVSLDTGNIGWAN
jgi:hypothetical protein